MQEQKEGTAVAPRAGSLLLYDPRLGALGEAVGGVFFVSRRVRRLELMAIWGGYFGQRDSCGQE